jgi:hypothetical protein
MSIRTSLLPDRLDPASDSMTAMVVASPRDRFATALVDALRAAGRQARQVDVTTAARSFTVTVGDRGSEVSPALPMVIRCPVAPELDDPDERFLYGECLAALWAAASLSAAPVLGRPGAMGFAGACASSAVVTELRGGMFRGRAEVFLNGSMQYPAGDGWWFRDQANLAVVSAAQHAAYPGPRRGRPVQPDEEYELVAVLHDQAWRRTEIALPGTDLAALSVTLARQLGLDFALVVWAVSPQRGLLGLARITPWPALDDVGFAWDAIVPAIMRFLWHDHGHRPG